MINAHSLTTTSIAHGQLTNSSFPVPSYEGRDSDSNSLSFPKANRFGRNPVKVSRPHFRIYNSGRWSAEERYLFLVGLQRFGHGNWKQVGSILRTR
eukprot:scaffold3453_cov54-Attheya_sp.AAC.3